MRARFKLWYANSKNQINMTKFIAVSVLLLAVVWLVDIRYPQIKGGLPEFLLLPTDVSKTFLSNLSGVFLTVTTFTFATMLTVLNSYSSNFTPRVVQKFIDKPYVLSLLGIFIGGFFYTILSLFFLQGIQAEKSVLAGTLGVLYGVMSMSYLVFFMQRVLRDMKGAHLIQDIYEEALTLVEEEAMQRKESDCLGEDRVAFEMPIAAIQTGYLFGVDFQRLFFLLQDIPGELVIDKKIGEYVSEEMEIARLRLAKHPKHSKEQEEEFPDTLAQCFLYSDQKNETYDYHHELTNLVEIALRGLSPGINDPNTAINCIGKLSVLLGKLISTRNHYIVARQNESMKVIYTSYTVLEELYLTFYQIIHYGKSDPSVACAILEGLIRIYMIADASADDALRLYFDYAYDILKGNMEHALDIERVEMLRQDFLKEQEKKRRSKK